VRKILLIGLNNGEKALHADVIKSRYPILTRYFPDLIVSYNCKQYLSKEMIDFVNANAINLHISYLPSIGILSTYGVS